MKDSEFGDLKTESKRTVQKIELLFEDMIFEGRKFRMKFFPWIRTNELKKTLVKEKYKNLTENDIRLFCKNIELTQQNKNPFEFYKIQDGSTVFIRKNSNVNKTENGVINPYRIFQTVPQQITSLIINVQSGLNAGRKPKLAAQGTSGTYFLENNQKKVAVFKPYDQEPYTPNNPRGYPGKVGQQGIRKGILSGECATREVAAYLLDFNKRFHEVPLTTYVQFYHPCFTFNQLCSTPIVSQKESILNKARTKHGSLQQFVQYKDIVGNLGSHQFQISQVHKIAILDLRILNCDRNEANILVVKKMSGSKGKIKTSLIPIDHGLSFPDNFEIYQYQIVWMGYKQVNIPLNQEQLQFIDAIDPVKDCQTLRQKLGFRQICLRNFRIAQTFLKRLAKVGFSLFQIGKFAYREDDSDWQSEDQGENKKPSVSELQRLVKQAELIYNTVRDNGIKSTAQFQIGLRKNKKMEEEEALFKKEFKELSSEERGLQLMKKVSKIKETSIEKRQIHSENNKRPRNISLPNLKKKPSRKDRRMKEQKRKNKDRGLYSKEKGQKWGELFFHYFEELLDRFVIRKLQMKNNQPKFVGRGRLMSQDIY